MKINIKNILIAIIVIFVQTNAFSQAPTTAIFLVDMNNNNGSFTFGTPEKITTRTEYNSQPSFDAKGRYLYYSSAISGQTDIFKYDVNSGWEKRLTFTSDAEYSPIVIPNSNYFSVIHLGLPGGKRPGAQPLQKFHVEVGDPIHVFENGEKVGYHAWANEDIVYMFILGNPARLFKANIKTGETTTIFESVGRSIHKIPGKNEISFSHNMGNGEHTIKRIDVNTDKITDIVKMYSTMGKDRDGNDIIVTTQDYAWANDGTILMGTDSKLYAFNPDRDSSWREIADFSESGISGISRIAINPQTNFIAIVSNQ